MPYTKQQSCLQAHHMMWHMMWHMTNCQTVSRSHRKSTGKRITSWSQYTSLTSSSAHSVQAICVLPSACMLAPAAGMHLLARSELRRRPGRL